MVLPDFVTAIERWRDRGFSEPSGNSDDAVTNLYRAILLQAVDDADRGWFERTDENCIVSLVECCCVLNLDPEAVRKACLAQLPEPRAWVPHLHDDRLEREEEGYTYTHEYKTCDNRNCAECEQRRYQSERRGNWREKYLTPQRRYYYTHKKKERYNPKPRRVYGRVLPPPKRDE